MLTLTPAQPSKAGSVFLAAHVPLFSYQLIGDTCGRHLAFSSSFSFTLTRPAASGSEGFAFVVAFDATPPTTPVAGGMGYAGMGARSVAVEFDTSMDAGNSDPDSNHVGINTGGNATSVVTAKHSTPLNDGTPKHVWIDYDPSSSGPLRVFLSSQAIEAALGILSNTSAAPVLSVEQLKVAMKVGCSGSTPSQAFQLLLKLAQKGGGLVLESQGPAEKGKKAVVKAGSSSPLCSPLLKPLAKLFGVSCGKGSDSLPGGFPIKGFESTSFYGWFGLLLAVQRQPVVVHIEASADTFKSYDGYLDPACFTYKLNHVVLMVGYRLVGKDSRFPHMAPPFWIIRNSWGPDWGDGGHMRMDIQGGDGVCGINSLPGLYPVVRAGRGDSSGSLFNPCGKFTCIGKGKTNECDCNDPHFIQATNADGSRTCAYKDACKAAQRNPCAVGQCVNDGAGSYSCVCPPGFRQGTTVEGTFSCAPGTFSCAPGTFSCALDGFSYAPGGNSNTYTVLSPNVRCSDVFPVYGLTLAEFQTQNVRPIPPSTVLKVASPASLIPCSVFYTTQQVPTPPSTPFQALNPSLDCTANGGLLQPEQTVSVERLYNVLLIPVCSQYYLVQSAETCESIRNVPYPPPKPVDFFCLNPGIKCNRLIPNTDIGSFTGFEVTGNFVVTLMAHGAGEGGGE
ncbi:unnamed protein product [Closterium sp. NIES-64]|nr:unnamed protein product [Closterium sp. NIES-64]